MARSLPPVVEQFELGDWASVTPDELLEDPAAVYRLPEHEYAARALRYSRRFEQTSVWSRTGDTA